MSYRCGTSGLEALGIPSDDPRIICDKCGAVRYIRTRTGAAPAWFLDGRAAPGWKMKKKAVGLREDFCPECKKEGGVG